MQIWSLGWEDPLEEAMATHSITLAWEIPWTEEPDGLQSMEVQRVRHDWSDWACTQSPTGGQKSKLWGDPLQKWMEEHCGHGGLIQTVRRLLALVPAYNESDGHDGTLEVITPIFAIRKIWTNWKVKDFSYTPWRTELTRKSITLRSEESQEKSRELQPRSAYL